MIPLGGRVLIKVDVQEEKTKGGVIIPDSSREKKNMAETEATILAIGDGAFKNDQAGFYEGARVPKVGDKVVAIKYAGLLVDEKENTRICWDDDILAVKGENDD